MRIADCGLRIADCGLRIADCGGQRAVGGGRWAVTGRWGEKMGLVIWVGSALMGVLFFDHG
jgi:hypothetical protein